MLEHHEVIAALRNLTDDEKQRLHHVVDDIRQGKNRFDGEAYLLTVAYIEGRKSVCKPDAHCVATP